MPVVLYAGALGGPRWLAPLLFFLPLILQLAPSIILGPFVAFGWLLQQLAGLANDSAAGGLLLTRVLSRRRRRAAGIGDLDLAIALLLPGVIAFLLYLLLRHVRARGWRRVLRHIFSRPGDPARNGGPQGRSRPQQNREQRFDRVTSALCQLPAEEYMGREELMSLSAHELKAKLRERKLDIPSGALEKEEIVQRLLEAGGSSGAACSICCEEYASGDVLRRLRCNHGFHLECIDRWLLSSTDYSRPPACPMCNSPLDPAAAAAS